MAAADADDIRPAAAEAAADEPPPPAGLPPGMPPADESGFPSLPMFGGEINELFSSLSAAQSVFSLNTALRDGVMTSGMAMLSENASQAQVGTQLQTSRGTLKAELVSQGMLQTSFEGFSPLPFVNLNTQLAFVPAGLAGGVLQTMLLTPVGVVMGCVNTGAQMSCEVITGAQPSPTSQVMLGCHWWGMPGLLGGVKASLEVQNMVLVEKEEGPQPQPPPPPTDKEAPPAADKEQTLIGSSAVTLAVTAPFVSADGTKLDSLDPSLSLSVFQRISPTNSLAASIDRSCAHDAAAPDKLSHKAATRTRACSHSLSPTARCAACAGRRTAPTSPLAARDSSPTTRAFEASGARRASSHSRWRWAERSPLSRSCRRSARKARSTRNSARRSTSRREIAGAKAARIPRERPTGMLTGRGWSFGVSSSEYR